MSVDGCTSTPMAYCFRRFACCFNVLTHFRICLSSSFASRYQRSKIDKRVFRFPPNNTLDVAHHKCKSTLYHEYEILIWISSFFLSFSRGLCRVASFLKVETHVPGRPHSRQVLKNRRYLISDSDAGYGSNWVDVKKILPGKIDARWARNLLNTKHD